MLPLDCINFIDFLEEVEKSFFMSFGNINTNYHIEYSIACVAWEIWYRNKSTT